MANSQGMTDTSASVDYRKKIKDYATKKKKKKKSSAVGVGFVYKGKKPGTGAQKGVHRGISDFTNY